MATEPRPVGSETVHYGTLTQADAFKTLENLREMGVVNMYGAAPVLRQVVGKRKLSEQDAKQALLDWMAAWAGMGKAKKGA